MAAPIQVRFADVEAAVAELRRRGVEIGYLNGHVVGLAALRGEVGGDAGRVRSMAILLLERDGLRIPPAEVRLAKCILDTERVAKRAAKRGARGAHRQMAIMMEGLIDRVAALAAHPHTGREHVQAMPEDVTLDDGQREVPGRSQKATPPSARPVEPANGEVRYGTRQKPVSAVGGGLLAQIRASRNTGVDGQDTFDPYDLNAVESRRAGDPPHGTYADDDPIRPT